MINSTAYRNYRLKISQITAVPTNKSINFYICEYISTMGYIGIQLLFKLIKAKMNFKIHV